MVTFLTRVKKIEKKSRRVRSWKEGDDVRVELEDLGWFVLLEGSWESLYVGSSPPEGWAEGDEVLVTIDKAIQIGGSGR